MTLTPGYGETPVDPEDLDALTTAARVELGDDPTKAELYDYEQAILMMRAARHAWVLARDTATLGIRLRVSTRVYRCAPQSRPERT